MTFRPFGGTRNFIDKIIYDPCEAPLWIYVATFLPAFIEMIFTLSVLDFDDIVRARAEGISKRALGGRGNKHFSRPVARKSGDLPVNERYAARALKTLLIITAPLEFIGFGILLYGAVDQFYYNWEAYLTGSRYCEAGGVKASMMRRTVDSRCTPNEGGGAITAEILVYNTGQWPTSPFSVDLPIGKYNVIVAVTIVGPGGPGASYGLGLFVTGASFNPVFRGPRTIVTEGQDTDLVESFQVLLPSVLGGRIAWEIVGPPVPVGLEVKKARVIIQLI